MLAVFYSGNDQIEIKDVPVPFIDKNEILLKVKAASICGTDIKIKKFGHFKNPENKKLILGHEVSGIIEKVGTDVKCFSKGMRVSVSPNIGCGICAQCTGGYTNYCEDYEAIGVSLDGSFAEYMRIPSKYIIQGNVVTIPDNISFEEASLAEPLSTVVYATEVLNIAPPDSVLIIGAGPMGILHLMMARLRGAAKIIVSEVSKSRREQAILFGADKAVSPEESNLKNIIFEETKGQGANVIITAAPSGKIQEDSLDLIATRGRINFFGGLPKGKDIINIKSNIIHYKNIILTGTTGQSVSHYRKAIDILSSGGLNVSGLISARYHLNDAKAAFEAASLESSLKVLFVF